MESNKAEEILDRIVASENMFIGIDIYDANLLKKESDLLDAVEVQREKSHVIQEFGFSMKDMFRSHSSETLSGIIALVEMTEQEPLEIERVKAMNDIILSYMPEKCNFKRGLELNNGLPAGGIRITLIAGFKKNE